MKKILSWLLVITMVCSFVPMTFAAWNDAPGLSLTATNDNGTVTVTLATTEATELSALNFNLNYPTDKVTLKSKQKDLEKNTGFYTASDGEGGQMEDKATISLRAGTVGYAIAVSSNTAFAANSMLFAVDFTINDGAAGKIDFTLSNLSAGQKPAGSYNYTEPETPSTYVSVPLTSLALTGSVTTPTKGSTDSSSITAGTGYTGAVTWAPELVGGKFAANTVYTATVTLTPKTGYVFADNMTVTGLDGFTFAKSGNNYVATKQFDRTEDKSLTKLEVTTQPTKTAYTHGETFDATGMVVKATYDDASTDAAFTDYTVVYQSGNYLKKGDTKVTLKTANDKTDTVTLSVGAKELEIVGLAATDRTYNKSNLVALTGGELSGVINGEDVTVVIPTSGTVASADVGTDKAVTVDKPSLGGTDAASYTLADITSVTVNITPAQYTYTYGKTTDTSYIGSNVPAGGSAVCAGLGMDEITGTLSWYTDSACTQAATGTFTETGSKTLYWKFVPAVNDVNANYVTDAKTGSVVYTVESLPPQSVTFHTDPVTKTYGDAGFTYAASNDTPIGGAITYSSSNTDVAAVNASTGAVTVKGVGTAVITATAAEVPATYAATPKSYTLTVAPKTVGLTWAGYTGLTYDGKAKNVTATATELVGTDTCSVTVTGGTETNAGTHTATAAELSNANYTLPATKTQTYTIAQKNLSTVTIASVSAVTYNGSEQKPEPAVSFNNDETVTLTKGTDFTYSYSNNTNKGTATVTITAVDDGNYAGTNSTTFAINAKPVTAVKGTLVVTKEYDGSTSAGTIESGALALDGVVGSDEVTISGTIGAYASANYGTGINVTITGLTLDGVDKDNYVLSTTSGTFAVGKITKIRVKNTDYELTIPQNAVYNGKAQPLTAAKKTAAIGELTVLYDGSAAAPKNAGTYAVTLKVAESTNYEAESGIAIGSYTIAQKEAALSWDGYTTRTYDGSKSNVTATVSNLVPGDSCTVTVTDGDKKDAGTYTATASTLSNTNYTLTGAIETAKQYIINPKTLTKADLEYKSGAKTKVYDGTTAAADIVVGVKSGVLASGDTLEINGTAAYNDKDVADASKITFTPTAITSGNYRLAATETLEIPEATITKKALTITGVKATDRDFIESNTAVTLADGALVGVVGSETVSFTLGTGEMANDAVGARKAVTTAITLSGADMANYTLTQPTDVTVNIFAAQTAAVDAATGKDATTVVKPADATADETATANAVGNTAVGGDAAQQEATNAVMQEASNAAISDQSKVDSAIEAAKDLEPIKTLLAGGTSESDIKIAAVPFIAVEVKEASLSEPKSIAIDIDFKLQLKATVGALSDPDKTVSVGTPETVSVNEPVTLSIPLPDGFIPGGNGEVYIAHNHDGKTYIYRGTVTGNVLTFTSLYGLSDFTLVPTLATVAEIDRTGLGTLYFETLQSAVDEVANGETIKITANAGSATVSREVSFSVSGGFTHTITAGSGYTLDNSVANTYTVTRTGGGGGGGGGAAPTAAVSVGKTDNGTVSANVAKAKKGDTVTVTVKPEDGYKLDTLTVTDKNGKTVTLKKVSDTKYTFTMPDGKVSIAATFVESKTETAMSFTDVVTNDWYYDAIKYAFDNGLMNGTGDGKFSPNATTTRGMIFTVLARNAGVDTTGSGNLWYTVGMNWAKEQGISDGTMPEGNITREQLATMLYRYALLKGVDTKKYTENTNTLSHTDVFTISDWASEGMHFCIAAGVIGGDTNGMLNPTNNATRAEVATMLMRFLEQVK